MFKRIAILTALAATASSAAYAAPWPFGRVEADVRIHTDHDRYDRYDRDYDGRYNRGRDGWAPLATRLYDSNDIVLDHRERFSRIAVRAHGRVTVGAIAVTYANGQTQNIGVSKQMRRGETVTVQLQRRMPVRSIRVAISGGGQASYSVFAR